MATVPSIEASEEMTIGERQFLIEKVRFPGKPPVVTLATWGAGEPPEDDEFVVGLPTEDARLLGEALIRVAADAS